MGQSTPAIAYGVVMDEVLDKIVHTKLMDEDGYWYGFDDKDDYPDAVDHQLNPPQVLGYVVLLDGHDDDNRTGRSNNLHPFVVPVHDIEKMAGERMITRARRLWARLSDEARRRGVELGEPSFIITTVEIA